MVGKDNREQLRRIIRYLKGWAAVAFEDLPDSRPSSIFLTVIAAEAFNELWGSNELAIADDDALIAIVGKIFTRLSNGREVPNPVDPDNEDLNRISEDSWDEFLTTLAALNEAAQLADTVEDEISAAFAWESAFSFLMPLPEAEEIEVVDEGSARALMQVPDIDINIYEREGGKLLATYRNEVQSVPKDRWLVFTIANQQIVPGYADISWTVRNDGEEADNLGDLGHFRRGINMFSTGRGTAYIGKHYMDCIIRVNGAVYAVRRVPVHIAPNHKGDFAQIRRRLAKISTYRGPKRR